MGGPNIWGSKYYVTGFAVSGFNEHALMDGEMAMGQMLFVKVLDSTCMPRFCAIQEVNIQTWQTCQLSGFFHVLKFARVSMEREGGLGSLLSNVTANDMLTCAAHSIQGPVELPINPYVPLVTRCLLTLYFMMVAFFGTVLNSFVIYLVCMQIQVPSHIIFHFCCPGIDIQYFRICCSIAYFICYCPCQPVASR